MNGTKTFLIIVAIIVVAGAGIYFAKNKTDKEQSGGKTEQTADSGGGEVAGTTNSDTSQDSSQLASKTEIMFFYGSTCPHCKKVEEFIANNNIEKKLNIKKYEVYSNNDNANLMTEKQKLCKNLSEDDKGGVPFVYTSDKCLVGDTPIIDFLKQEAGIQ
jgi:hypothetical protein